MSNKYRSYCFTWNNYPVNYKDILEQMFLDQKFQYLVFAPEIAPTTGTNHIQGYFYSKSLRTMSGWQKKEFKGLGIAMKIANGTADDNEIYICGPYEKDGKQKDANPEAVILGKKPKQGARNDLKQLVEDVKNGTKVDDILLDNPVMYHMYGRTLNAVEDLMLLRRNRSWMTKGIWIWGKSGVGKSYEALRNYNYMTHYIHNLNDNGWWDGYKGQEIVVLNEFRGQIAFGELLDLVDWVPKTVKRRNRQPIPFLAKLVIITSSMPPEQVYPKVFDPEKNRSAENRLQFDRRFVVDQKCSRGNIELSRHLPSSKEDEEVVSVVLSAPQQEYEEF